MGTEQGQNLDRVIADLERNGPNYDVFQAIYLAEIASRKFVARKDLGLDQSGLHFRPYENYVYPPTDIRSIALHEDAKRRSRSFKFVLNFMGLYGVNAVLPRCYHEQVAMQQSAHGEGEVPLQNFLDIFNNRFYWLYYQAWKKYRYYLQLSEAEGNVTAQRIFAFIGQSFAPRHGASAIPRFQLLQFSGILSNRARSKAGLQILLSEFFPRYKVMIHEFVPQWVRLAETPTMGKTSANPFLLGKNSVVGRSMLDYSSRIRVEIGPMPFADYLDFTPEGKKAALLRELLQLYLNDGLEFDVTLIIASETIVTKPWKDKRIKLGTSMWLGRPREEFVDVPYSYEKYVGKR